MELQPTLETCSNNSNSSSMDNEDILEGWLCVAPMGNSLEGNFPDALPATKPSTPPSVNSEKQNTPPESRASNSSAISALDQSPLSGVSSSGHSLTIASSGNTSAEPPAPRKRRGHTKSRLGCITCKRRKIKVCHALRQFVASCANMPPSAKNSMLQARCLQLEYALTCLDGPPVRTASSVGLLADILLCSSTRSRTVLYLKS